MRNKLKITQAILDQLPEEIRSGFRGLDDAMMYFWMNIRDTGGLRLTCNGYNVLTKILKLGSYSLELDSKHITKQNILRLDRKLTAPYYIEIKKAGGVKLVLFSSREAMMASLYGDLTAYLQTQ